jgi:hypothetical protein
LAILFIFYPVFTNAATCDEILSEASKGFENVKQLFMDKPNLEDQVRYDLWVIATYERLNRWVENAQVSGEALEEAKQLIKQLEPRFSESLKRNVENTRFVMRILSKTGLIDLIKKNASAINECVPKETKDKVATEEIKILEKRENLPKSHAEKIVNTSKEDIDKLQTPEAKIKIDKIEINVEQINIQRESEKTQKKKENSETLNRILYAAAGTALTVADCVAPADPMTKMISVTFGINLITKALP